MWGHGFGGYGWAGMIFGGLMMLLFWGGLIVLIFLGIRAFSHGGSGQSGTGPTATRSPGQSAIEVLKERYARGEITKEEYDSIRRDLEG